MFVILVHLMGDLWEIMPGSGEFFSVPEAKQYITDLKITSATKIVHEHFAELFTNPEDDTVLVPYWSDEQVELGEDV